MSRKVKHGSYVALFGTIFLGLTIAISFVWSQINVKGQDNNVIDIEIQVDADEQEVDKLFAEAEALNRPGTKEQSLDRFEKIVQKHPNSNRLPKIYLRMGGLARQIEQPEKAIEYYQKIIDTAPDYSPARVLYELGHAYVALKDYPKALATYQEIIDRWPDTEMALQAGHTKGGHHYGLAGRGIDPTGYEQAIAEYRKVVEHDVDTNNHHHKWKASAVYWIGMAYLEMRRYDEAIAAFQERLDRFGPLDKAQYMIGETHRQARRYTEAIAAFSKVVEAYPSYERASDAQYWIGELQEIQGKRSRAKQAYQKTRNLYPDSDSALAAEYRIKMIETEEDPISQAE